MKILIDLRSVDYGLSGGIENYAYYLIESIKNRDVEIILDVPFTSRKKYKRKYKNDKNIKIISDPVQWAAIYSKSNNKIISTSMNLLGKTFFRWFNIEFLRRRERWANSIDADLVYYPYHLDELQHFKFPVVTTIHALLPGYSELHLKTIDSHIKKAKALITSWNYPYQELIEKYPSKRDSWYLIHYIAIHNVNVNKQIKVDGIDYPYYLYV
jgi:glycosyltransferase involved in cell wall biosynthesis